MIPCLKQQTRCVIVRNDGRRYEATTEAKHYDYANLTGHYEDIDDYKPMCRSCHWRYDKKHLNFQVGSQGVPTCPSK